MIGADEPEQLTLLARSGGGYDARALGLGDLIAARPRHRAAMDQNPLVRAQLAEAVQRVVRSQEGNRHRRRRLEVGQLRYPSYGRGRDRDVRGEGRRSHREDAVADVEAVHSCALAHDRARSLEANSRTGKPVLQRFGGQHAHRPHDIAEVETSAATSISTSLSAARGGRRPPSANLCSEPGRARPRRVARLSKRARLRATQAVRARLQRDMALRGEDEFRLVARRRDQLRKPRRRGRNIERSGEVDRSEIGRRILIRDRAHEWPDGGSDGTCGPLADAMACAAGRNDPHAPTARSPHPTASPSAALSCHDGAARIIGYVGSTGEDDNVADHAIGRRTGARRARLSRSARRRVWRSLPHPTDRRQGRSRAPRRRRVVGRPAPLVGRSTTAFVPEIPETRTSPASSDRTCTSSAVEAGTRERAPPAGRITDRHRARALTAHEAEEKLAGGTGVGLGREQHRARTKRAVQCGEPFQVEAMQATETDDCIERAERGKLREAIIVERDEVRGRRRRKTRARCACSAAASSSAIVSRKRPAATKAERRADRSPPPAPS